MSRLMPLSRRPKMISGFCLFGGRLPVAFVANFPERWIEARQSADVNHMRHGGPIPIPCSLPVPLHSLHCVLSMRYFLYLLWTPNLLGSPGVREPLDLVEPKKNLRNRVWLAHQVTPPAGGSDHIHGARRPETTVCAGPTPDWDRASGGQTIGKLIERRCKRCDLA